MRIYRKCPYPDGQNIRRNHDGAVDSDVIQNLVMKELADLMKLLMYVLPVSAVLLKMLME